VQLSKYGDEFKRSTVRLFGPRAGRSSPHVRSKSGRSERELTADGPVFLKEDELIRS
jgi:hypothetical protein